MVEKQGKPRKRGIIGKAIITAAALALLPFTIKKPVPDASATSFNIQNVKLIQEEFKEKRDQQRKDSTRLAALAKTAQPFKFKKNPRDTSSFNQQNTEILKKKLKAKLEAKKQDSTFKAIEESERNAKIKASIEENKRQGSRH